MKNSKPEDDLFQNEPVENRAQLLEDQSCRSEDMQVKRDFNSSQLTELKDELSTVSINVEDKKLELAEITKSLKAEIKQLEIERKSKIRSLKLGYETSDETVYLMDDQDSGKMHYYDAEGKYLHSRKLSPAEKQTKIHQINKAG